MVIRGWSSVGGMFGEWIIVSVNEGCVGRVEGGNAMVLAVALASTKGVNLRGIVAVKSFRDIGLSDRQQKA